MFCGGFDQCDWRNIKGLINSFLNGRNGADQIYSEVFSKHIRRPDTGEVSDGNTTVGASRLAPLPGSLHEGRPSQYGVASKEGTKTHFVVVFLAPRRRGAECARVHSAVCQKYGVHSTKELYRGSTTRPRKRHAPLGTCWIAKRNGRSTFTSMGSFLGAAVALAIVTAVAAAASAPFSSMAMNVL